MLFVAFFQWWYGDGWRQRARVVGSQLDGTLDYFSIELLVKTLFSPFRQISAGKVQGSLGDQLRAFGDRLISRIIGAIVRLAILIIGLVFIALQVIFSGLLLALWAIVPALPVIGIILTLMRWNI